MLPSYKVSSVRLLLSAGVVLAFYVAAGAEEPLRWKFEKGAKYDYNMVQDMKIQGPQNVTMHQELKMLWDVADVTPEGDAVIEQKIEQVKMKMQLPFGTIDYDSASPEPPAGPAANLAPMYNALMKGNFKVTMSPRGEIKDVVVPPEIVAALKNSPGAAMGDLASEEGFKKMMKQGSLQLPEKALAEGEEFSAGRVEMNNPNAGKQVIETVYKYLGTKEEEGVEFARFEPKITLKFEGAPVKITNQESTGEILFNVAEGRLDSSTIKQQVTMEQEGGGATTINQDIKVTVKPAGEQSSDAAAKDAEESKDTK